MTGTEHTTRTARRVRTADGADLNVVVEGAEDAPVTVVLVHGWTLGHEVWEAQSRALTARGDVRVVRYDQRGHGASTCGTALPWSIDLLGEDLAAVVSAAAPHGPLVLAGHSMGGMTIMALAAAEPGLFAARVAGVVLAGTSAGRLVPSGRGLPVSVRLRSAARTRFFALGARHPGAFTRGRALLPGPDRPAHLRVVRHGLFGPAAPVDAVRTCARMLHAAPIPVLCGYFPALIAHDKAGALSALATVPVHIVVGDRDRLTPPAHSRRLARELPDAVLRIEEGCGHMVVTERPDSVTVPLLRMCAQAADGRPERAGLPEEPEPRSRVPEATSPLAEGGAQGTGTG